MGVHVAHPPCNHGPAAMASSGLGNINVLVASHGECYLETVVVQGAKWARDAGFVVACPELPRELDSPAVDYVPASPHGRCPPSGGGPGGSFARG